MNRGIVGLICFLLGVIAVPVGALLYLRYGDPPVAVTDPSFPFEKQIVHIPMQARINREMPGPAPIQATPDALAAGAVIYRDHCAFCHGLLGSPSQYGPHMFPRAPQLWRPHGKGVVGVSDDPVGETFWKVKNGIRLTGMPGYADLLSQQQMWQVSLLLSSAAKPLPLQAEQALSH